MRKTIILAFVLSFFMSIIDCLNISAEDINIDSIDYYTKIPNVTRQEIDAIEKIKTSRKFFTYGAMIGTEMFVQPDGKYEGFTYRYCELLSQLFGIEFKVEMFDDWSLLKSGYDNSTIDFFGELSRTQERMDIYQMSSPIAEHSLRIFTLESSGDIIKEQDINGKKIGFLTNTITAVYIKKAYPTLSFESVDIDTYEEAANKLLSGEIDLFVEGADADLFFLDYEDIVTKKFFAMVYIPISMSSANNELAPLFSVIDKYLAAGGLDKLLEMYKSGECEYAKFKFNRSLTSEEKEYLDYARENHVKLALESGNYPISFYNESEREFQGIAVDLISEISKISEIEFDVVTDSKTSWPQVLNMLRSGEAEMVSQLLYTEEREGEFIWSESPYSISQYALLSAIDYPVLSNYQVLRTNVGTIIDSAHEDVFFAWFPEYKDTKRYTNQTDGVKALQKGEIDLLMASEFILLSQTNYYENTGLKINILLSTPMDSYFGFNKDEQTLASIINKVQSYIDTDFIERNWTSRKFDYEKKAATERMYYFFFLALAVILVLIPTIFLFIKNKRLNKKLSELVADRSLELEQKNATLATIYDSIPDIVFSLDTNLKYTSCNLGFEKFAGFSESDVVGKSDMEIFGDNEMSRYFNAINKLVLKAKSQKIIEEVVVTADKKTEVLETIKTPLFQNGELVGILGIARNITERKSADERTRLMLNSTPLCCSLLNEKFDIIDCNEEAVSLFGLIDKSEYLERFYTLAPKYQPDGQKSIDKIHEKVREAFECGRVVFEWISQKPDGEMIPCEITIVRINDYMVAGYNRDLREYKKMLDEIEHKGYLLQTVNNVASILLQSGIEEFDDNLRKCMGMMAVSVDADRVYIWKNYKEEGQLLCSQIFEWSERANPQQGNEITSKVNYNDVMPGLEEMLSSGQCINRIVCELPREVRNILELQSIISILIVPIFLHDEFWGFVGFDDCHRERLFSANEEAVLRSGSILIANALLRNEMTLDIRAAVDAAQAASRAKSSFLSNMSHEIRTPLNAITGMTLIGKTVPDIEKKNYAFNKIEDASNHLLGVVNDILDMSKIEANKFEFLEEEFNFEKMLQSVYNFINFRMHEKKQRFSIYIDKNIPEILVGDNQRIAQVITNLLSNAVKFTPDESTIRLDADLLSDEDDICTIQVAVTDTGIGIAPERQEYIFESFEQADNKTSRKFGGTGLGLSISKYIVELMGGKIWVESTLGKGSKFTFTLKLKRGSQRSDSVLSDIDISDVQVLVVDDEPDTREYFKSIAQQLGISCSAASSGEEALKLIDSGNNYNIFFVDWNMPVMSGIELSGKIKARRLNNSVIIMISSFDLALIEKEAKKAGVDKFLPKPLFPGSVADCINECLGIRAKLNNEEKESEEISFKGYRMLLAEDVEINRDIVMTLLESTQIDIDCAQNGIEVVQMFKDAPQRYDLIFMDIQMPEMDGLQATREIRALDFARAKEIPIIAMTANVFREDIEQCKEAGMNEHIGKPLNLDDMLFKMRQYLHGAPQSSVLPPQ